MDGDWSCDFLSFPCAGLLPQILSKHALGRLSPQFTSNADTYYPYNLSQRDLEKVKIQTPLYTDGGISASVLRDVQESSLLGIANQ